MTWKCPKCQSLNLAVEVKIMAKLYQSKENFETEDDGGGHEWDETSHMQCGKCGFSGKAHEFDTSAAKLYLYHVTYKDEADDKFTAVFECWAEDAEHAYEQCEDAYPWAILRNATRMENGDAEDD